MRTTALRVCAVLLVSVCGASAQYTVQTVAGSLAPAEQIPAIAAPLASVEGMAVDLQGNLYVADTPDHRVRRISPQGIITTIAGNGRPGYSGDNGPALQASLQFPYGLSVDPFGNVYIADLGNARVRRVGTNGIITTVAGGGTREVSYFGASIRGTEAKLSEPRNVLLDEAGNLFISDFGAHRIYLLAGDGMLAHIAGARESGNAPVTASALTAPLKSPTCLAFDRGGSLYVADAGNGAIRRLRNGVMQRVYATGPSQKEVFYAAITGMSIDGSGDLFVVDGKDRPLRRINPLGQVSEYPRTGREVAVDARGNVYLSEGTRIWRYWSGGSELFAGSGGYLFSGDGGLATQARLRSPGGVAIDAQGQLILADTANQRIRRVRTDGRIETVATGFPQPVAVAVDRNTGVIYISDATANTVSRIQTDGRVDTLIDKLAKPAGITLDPQGRLLIAESGGGRVIEWSIISGVREIAVGLRRPIDVAFHPSGDLVILEAGSGCILRRDARGSVTGLCGLALSDPAAIAVHPDGSLIIAEHSANRVVRVETNGSRTVFAGEEEFRRPADVAVTPAGEVYVADQENHRIARISAVVTLPSTEPPSFTALVSAATLEPAAAVPGALMVATGRGIGPATPSRGQTENSRFLPTLAGWEVRFDSIPAPVIDGEEGRLLIQVPYGIAGRARAQVTVLKDDFAVGTLNVEIAELGPALYPEIRHADGGVNLPANPAQRGSSIRLLVTGTGLWNRSNADGEWFAEPLDVRPVASVTVRIGNIPAEVESLRPVPGQVGLLELRVRVADSLAAGSNAVQVLADGIASPPGPQLWVR